MRNSVKLQRPTDFLILELLAKKGRNVAVNIALEIDKSRSHVNVRLPILHDYGLVTKIGPAENSGLYEITEKGELVLEHRSKYKDPDIDFDEFIENELDPEDLEGSDAMDDVS